MQPNGKRKLIESGFEYQFCDDLWRYIKEFAIDYDILALDECSRENLNERMSEPTLPANAKSLINKVYKWLGGQMRRNKQCKVCGHCNKKTNPMFCNTETETGKVWCNVCAMSHYGLFERLQKFEMCDTDWNDIVEACLEDIPDLYELTNNTCDNDETEDDSDSDEEDEDEDEDN
jgi:hypothetical protein